MKAAKPDIVISAARDRKLAISLVLQCDNSVTHETDRSNEKLE